MKIELRASTVGPLLSAFVLFGTVLTLGTKNKPYEDAEHVDNIPAIEVKADSLKLTPKFE